MEEVTIESIYMYLKGKPHVEECFPFDKENLVFKIGGKMFALLPLQSGDQVFLKCDPERAIELRERYRGINGAYHFNKKHWNMVDINTNEIPAKLIYALIDHSYNLVYSKLPKKIKDTLNS